MKKLFSTIIFLLFIISCGNPCDDINCGPNGTCVESSESCLCDDYYEGDRCEREVREKYLGTWNSLGVCTSTNNTFMLDLTIT